MFKTTFIFGAVQHAAKESFQNTIEKAAALSIQDKETAKG